MSEELFVGLSEILFRRRAGKRQFARQIRHAEKAGELHLQRGEALLFPARDILLRLGLGKIW